MKQEHLPRRGKTPCHQARRPLRLSAGMRAAFGSDATPGSEELARLLEQIEENERNLNSLGLRAEAFERELDRMCAARNSAQAGEEVRFQIALIPTTPPPQMRAFALVRFARRDLLPAGPRVCSTKRRGC